MPSAISVFTAMYVEVDHFTVTVRVPIDTVERWLVFVSSRFDPDPEAVANRPAIVVIVLFHFGFYRVKPPSVGRFG